jgi:hypothetical protein
MEARSSQDLACCWRETERERSKYARVFSVSRFVDEICRFRHHKAVALPSFSRVKPWQRSLVGSVSTQVDLLSVHGRKRSRGPDASHPRVSRSCTFVGSAGRGELGQKRHHGLSWRGTLSLVSCWGRK